MNEKLRALDASTGDNIRCPLCWELFPPSALRSELSIEHVPPTAAARLIKELSLTTLTCKKCNHTYGSQYHSHFKKFLVFQLHQTGKYDKPIPGTITPSDSEFVPMKSNIVLTPKDIKIVGVPKANAPTTTENHISAWDSVAKNDISDWRFSVSLDYGFVQTIAWFAYLQVAYLVAYILTDCHYAFTRAGAEIRNILTQGNIDKIGPCVITPPKIGIGDKPWIAKIYEPNHLKCLWVKVGGNIVILPIPDDDKLSCYREWQNISEQTHLGLRPHQTRLKITCRSEDALVALQCLLHSSE